MHLRVLAIVSLIALAGCHLQGDPPGEAPSGVAVEPGDGRVTVTWDPEPGLTFWIFYRPGSSVVAAAPGVSIIFGAVSPHVVSNLVNGTQYAFVMNATKDDSRAGPSSAVVVATPRLAGASWVPGAALGTTQNMNGIAFSGSRLVVVGDSSTIFSGAYNYTSTNPPVTAWLPPTSLPAVTTSLTAVTYSSQFVALGTNGPVLTSPDGLTWALAASPVPSVGMNGIAFGGVYVAVGNGGSIFTSPADLSTWTQADSKTTNDLYSVSLLNGRFVVTGASGTLLTSTNGSEWIPQDSKTTSALRGAAFRSTPALSVVVGDAGTIVTSTDGTTWNPIAPPLSPNLSGVIFGSRFVAVGQGGAVAYSDDGTSWSLTSAGSVDLSRVIFTPAMYVAVGAAGANVIAK